MSKRTDIFMGTTEISAERSAGEITGLLVRKGASQIATDYQGGKVTGLRFVLVAAGNPVTFALPARTDAVFNTLKKHRPYKASYHRSTRQQYEDRLKDDAERIGWRQLLRWVEAQVALMDLGMVKAEEVFFPYVTMDGSGQTLFERFEVKGMKLLEAAKQ